ncbi:Predicted branched-chain amino acid permease (azaleucine resistance) [Roseivivax halotolerans]|jgi:predicted branched-subunit amino acid permease|uniref:Predicted branched-chain amino acid permease (Azaleucine resistance) n=2 Tax=Roseobacteraceae TaxID=2854170 RepID=A0A1I5YQH5_9RHOB|nr:Inner membrane protein YgaZ [Roseivivax sp. THAF30]SFQ46330.1 Predicted branched-chain amino acid permease (azaleucine resistance) [Roseivivax halotolerans]
MSSYRRGVRDGLPFLLVIVPFGMLFGVLATEAGLSVAEALGFSVVVIAGAAQFTALQLLQDEAPTFIVLGSALAINLRMAMYSASMTPYLGKLPIWKRAIAAYFLVDQVYACAALDYERHPAESAGQRFAYFMGVVTPICPIWYVATLIGALAGGAISTGYGLDFALPIAFLAMIGPMLRTGPHVVAALVGALAAILFAWLPFNLGLIAGGLSGMIAGAEAERRMMQRKLA